MAEIVQWLIDFFEWYFSTELPTDTLEAAKVCGIALFWLLERYVAVLGEVE